MFIQYVLQKYRYIISNSSLINLPFFPIIINHLAHKMSENCFRNAHHNFFRKPKVKSPHKLLGLSKIHLLGKSLRGGWNPPSGPLGFQDVKRTFTLKFKSVTEISFIIFKKSSTSLYWRSCKQFFWLMRDFRTLEWWWPFTFAGL